MNRILFVCNSVSIGGAERVVSILADEMIERDIEIFLLGFIKTDDSYLKDKRVKVIIAEKGKGKVSSKLIRITAIRKAIKKNNITTVIAFSHYNAMFSVIAAHGLNVKVIGSERNDPAQVGQRKVLNWLRMQLYKRLDALVCQTDDAKAYFPEDIQRKSVVILNPITDSLPAPYQGKRKHRIVSFSRLEPQKNIPMLLTAFEIFQKSHPDYVLDIYGIGSLREELIEKTKGNPSIHIQSFTADIHNAILDASIFALSSDYEGLSNSMIEAMGCGIPTIVTDCPCGGARMVIQDGEIGILVPVRDSKAMAEAMCRVADDKGLAEKLSREGLKIREMLDKKKIAEQWKAVIAL